MTQQWIIELGQEIRQMVQNHVEQFRDYYIIALEPDEHDDKGYDADNERPA